MTYAKSLSGVAMALLLAAGCSVETGDAELLENGEVAATGTVGEVDSSSLPSAAEIARDSVQLARIDFSDGNSVLFEEVNGGVLVTETGSDLNPNHLVPREGLTALEAFRALAPGREVPAALLDVHARLYEGASDLGAAVPSAAPDATELELDQDLEHNGQFQQSYPSSTFVQNMCNFPNTTPNYRQINMSYANTQTTPKIHTAYFAVASDTGIITAKACADGKCGAATTLQAGYHNSGFYDAGQKCEKSCVIFGLNCVTVCVPKQVKFDLVTGKISSTVRYHECAAFTK